MVARSIGSASFALPETISISKEGDVGSRRLFDVQRLEELEDKPFGVVDLLKEVDIRRYLPVEAHL